MVRRNLGKAAEYIRMSSDRQDLSPETQGRVLRQYADAHNLTIVRSYVDEGLMAFFQRRQYSSAAGEPGPYRHQTQAVRPIPIHVC